MKKRTTANTGVPADITPDHVSGDRFRHGTRLVRWRRDKSPRQCTFEQLEVPARPRRIVKDVIRPTAAEMR